MLPLIWSSTSAHFEGIFFISKFRGKLVDYLQEAPVHVIPCIGAGTEGIPTVMQSEVWGSVAPAVREFTRKFKLISFAHILRMFQPSLKLTYFFIQSCSTLLPFFLMNEGALIY